MARRRNPASAAVPTRAAYDYLGLAAVLRPRLVADGRGWRACADEIGCTSPDLSRICAGQAVSAEKVIAVCDWLNVSFRGFYRPPRPAGDGPAEREAVRVSHGKSTETGAAA